MRKFLSSAVLAVMLALANLVWPAAVLVPAEACCRTHGAHHCDEPSGDNGEHAFRVHCPQRLGATVLTRDEAEVLTPTTSLAMVSRPLQSAPDSLSDVARSFAPDGRSPPALL